VPLTLFLDTSALVKLYVVERWSPTVEKAVAASDRVFVSFLAYPEARAAFARRQREGAISAARLGSLVDAFDGEWESYSRVGVSEGTARLAGVLAEHHALRGSDAVHLACALQVEREERRLTFLTFDERLVAAAGQLLPCYPRSDA
jgi:predicted nucleic acid-binding protein